MARNKYHQILARILDTGKHQINKKGNITYLINEQLSLSPADLLEIFEGHGLARRKLRSELRLFMRGERSVEKYREAGINWWDYCGSILVNSYPTYFEKLPPLLARINSERRPSKNYVLFLGATEAESNQAPCLSLVQFQIEDGELVVSAYQRSSDANLGLRPTYTTSTSWPGTSTSPSSQSRCSWATCTCTTTISRTHAASL